MSLANRGKPVAEQRTKLREYLASAGATPTSIRSVLDHIKDGIALWPGKQGANTRVGGRPVLPRRHRLAAERRQEAVHVRRRHRLRRAAVDAGAPSEGTLAVDWDFLWSEHNGGGQMDFVAATRTFFRRTRRRANPQPPTSATSSTPSRCAAR